jgi:hypothetical protein
MKKGKTAAVPRRTMRATSKMAKAIGQLYIETRGKGPHWRNAVGMLAKVV